MSPWVCIAMLVITIGIMAATAEWLVDSIEYVREGGRIAPGEYADGVGFPKVSIWSVGAGLVPGAKLAISVSEPVEGV